MPNGNPKFNEKELPKLEEIFAPFSIELTRFAEKYNLLIDKYWHQFHSWRFSFKNPKGGIGCIEFSHEKDNLFVIYSFWWLDDYAKSTRFHYRNETDLFEAKAERISKKLEESLNEILSLQLGQWTITTSGFEDSWKIYGEEEFYKLNDKYPVPKL